MYQQQNRVTDSMIGNRLRQLMAEHNDHNEVAARLLAEGFALSTDGGGNVVIRKGGEECLYPLNITTLPSTQSAEYSR